MATRTQPPPRIIFEETPNIDHFMLNIGEHRDRFNKLLVQERRGEVVVQDMTWPPQIDHKGTPHVTVIYTTRRLLTQEEIDKKEKDGMESLNAQAKLGVNPLKKGPPPMPGVTFTKEELEYLTPFRENQQKDDED